MRLPDMTERSPNLWLPMLPDTSAFSSSGVVRVREGTTVEAAAKELDSIVVRAGLQEKFGKGYSTTLARPSEFVTFRSSLFLLSGAVALLLIVACANVAHLSLARGATRARELAIRAALGAGRTRLLRQLLTESLLLAVIGGVLGIGVAALGLKMLIVLRPSRLGLLSVASIDGAARWISVGLSVLTGLAFGLTAAIASIRRTTSESLRNTAVAGTATRQSHRLRSLLVVTEMALSAVLLVAATLLVRSVVKLRATAPGFPVADLYSVRFELPDRRYDAPGRRAFMSELGRRLIAVPGVRAVSMTHGTPIDAGIMMSDIEAQGIADPVARGTISESPEASQAIG